MTGIWPRTATSSTPADALIVAGPERDTLFERFLDERPPPVREEGERGFLTYETDEGRLHAPLETPADPRTVL